MPMIRSGRCDECRRRKRKCDEDRPTCSGCADRKVQCVYSTEVSKFIHLHQGQSGSSSESETASSTLSTKPKKPIVLNIRSSREPPQGNGLYHTFVPLKSSAKERARQAKRDAERKSPSISPPPCSDVYRLQSEFGSVLGAATTTGLRMHLFGHWLEMAIARIGTSLALDRSIACLIIGHRAKFAGDSRAMQLSRQRYGEALTALKDAVAGGASCVTAELIAATKMLMTFEIMLGSDIVGWLSHSYGAINLFLAVGPDACTGEFEKALFSSTYASAWQQAQMVGKPSVFDRPGWIELIRNGPVGTLQISGLDGRRRARVFTRLSRLTSLIRNVSEHPSDEVLARKAVKVAQELLDLDWTSDDDFNRKHRFVPTAREEDAELVPLSLHFTADEFRDAIGLSVWWACKIMLSGLCQTLHSFGHGLEWPSLSELYEEERRCAMLISMAMDYGTSLRPYGCAAFILPMQVAWGVYWRQKDFPLDVDCHAMLDWLMRRGNEFMELFNGRPMGIAGLAWFTTRVMGGPILPDGYLTESKVYHDKALVVSAGVERQRGLSSSPDPEYAIAVEQSMENMHFEEEIDTKEPFEQLLMIEETMERRKRNIATA